MSLRSTAASLSRIRKSGLSKKSPLSPLKPKPKQPKRAAPKSNDDDHSKLTILDHNVHLQYELSGQSSMLDAIDQLVFNQWSEQNMYHDRHYSQEAKQNASNSPSDLLFLLRGLSMEVKAEILKYRSHQLPSGILTVNQLYTMFDHMGNTFVDRSLEMCIRKGLIKKFVITNALPVILRNGQIGFNPKVTYGYENTDVVVKTEQYLSLIEESKDGDDGTLTKFRTYVENNPESLFVTNEDFSAPQLSLLVNLGFLTLTSNHHNEIDVHQYSISFPKCGTFLKIINAGRTWLVKTLGKSKYDELLEDVLFEKWEGKNLANFRKPFYGYDLLWVLADARGAGVVEAFNTPVGRGWRLTGKL
ncbi:CIC11C00000005799 [Sungouiella intermedia]|uniref:CIC11C00000005799 n=1 Tax=Sungouiella intermedia TaxID=45354 RepID=A0A1L0BDY6_9ASCO|nr:CIC11C00000005799 [[Candida] intermedia]